MQQRQGDLFFAPVNPQPNLKPHESNVLAYGEVTGHKHQVTTPMDQIESLIDEAGHIYLKSDVQDISISHEEHGQITLPKGHWYRVTRQREYDQVKEETRQVAD